MNITLDLDNIKQNHARRIAGILKVMFKQSIVKYRVSASGKGSHIIVINTNINEDEMRQIRNILGDDPRRNFFEKIFKQDQVLFDYKFYNKNTLKKYAGSWIEVTL